MNERTRYRAGVAAFLVFLAVLLLTIVEMRRGFLFSNYLKVGAPSVLLFLDWRQLMLLFIGGAGLWLAFRYVARHEANLIKAGVDLKTMVNAAALAIGAFLVIDLFIYRSVPASRFVAAGKMTAGSGTMGLAWALPIAGLPGWLQPAAEGVNYVLLVWHATVVGMLLGGLVLVAGASLITRLKGTSFSSHLTGAALAVVQPFCSCCAAPVGATLYRKGASLGPVLAFAVSSPMLNITSLVLAGAILPAEFALLRIGGGIIVGIFVTYGVSLLAGKWPDRGGRTARHGQIFDWASGTFRLYYRLFDPEHLLAGTSARTPAALISSWLGTAWRLARVMVPVLLVGSIVAVYVARLMPISGNNVTGVAVTSVFATLIMAPTWTEIALAAQLIDAGRTGIAAVVLIALPAVSIPNLVIISGAVRSPRVAVILGLAVLVASFLAGVLFLFL